MSQSDSEVRAPDTHDRRQRHRKVAMYSAVAGMAGASLATGGRVAEASVIAFNPPEDLPIVLDLDSMPEGYANRLLVDLDQNGVDDFYIYRSNAYGGTFVLWEQYNPDSGSVQTKTANFLMDSSYYALQRIDEGVEIGSLTFQSSATSYGSQIHAKGDAYSPPYTDFQTRGYLPVTFPRNPGTGWNSFYGFLDVEVDGTGDVLTIHGGAWESEAGTPITTPEPGALMGLAASAATLSALRRRRNRRGA